MCSRAKLASMFSGVLEVKSFLRAMHIACITLAGRLYNIT